MMTYGSDLGHGGVRQSAPSFSASLGQAHVTPTFSHLPASFMTRSGASYVDGAVPTSGQEVVWYPDSGATHHITNNRENLQSDAVYTDLKSSLMSSPDNVTNSGTFPLVIVNGGMQQMEKSDNGRGSTQDPLTFRGLDVTSGSGPAHASGSGPAHGCPSSPTLTPDQFSAKSGSSGLGPALQVGENKSSPTFQLNNGSNNSDMGFLPQDSLGYSNSDLERGGDCSSGNRGERLDFDERSSRGVSFEEPQSDLGIPSSSFRLGDFDSLQENASSSAEQVNDTLPLAWMA
ncbi:hypothetical protein V6N11_050527 [Hibiscus sabdariffa]|uniref:Uncharacterized protein n=2 Tax=Hibiscus sabdariffa TaxID=183260 RepID=A0ABR2TA38_9ROSI